MSYVQYRIENGVGIISLNRPEALNALNTELKEELYENLSFALHNSSVRSIVLTGEGRAFCAGGDVKNQSNRVNDVESRRQSLIELSHLISSLCHSPKPIITAINGFAVGAGLGLALTGDLVIASKKATFSTPFLKLGLVADAGVSYLASKRIGTARTKRLLLTNEMIDSQTAHEWGLVDWVVEPDELMSFALSLAEKLASSSSMAVGMIKSMLYKVDALTLDAALEQEVNNQVQCLMTDEHKQRVRAFVEGNKSKK